MPKIDKTQIVSRIQQRLNELEISANAASQMAGRNREWWGQIVRKPLVWPTTDNLIALCDAIGLRITFALTGRGARLVDDPDLSEDVMLVPRLSWVAAGRFTDAEPVSGDEVGGYIPATNLGNGDYIALSVVGDSMDLIAPEGSTVIVDRSGTELIDRKLYIVATETGSEATFKRYRADWPPRLEPFSNNKNHEAINIREPVRVIGRVVQVVNNV